MVGGNFTMFFMASVPHLFSLRGCAIQVFSVLRQINQDSDSDLKMLIERILFKEQNTKGCFFFWTKTICKCYKCSNHSVFKYALRTTALIESCLPLNEEQNCQYKFPGFLKNLHCPGKYNNCDQSGNTLKRSKDGSSQLRSE